MSGRCAGAGMARVTVGVGSNRSGVIRQLPAATGDMALNGTLRRGDNPIRLIVVVYSSD